MVSVPAPKILAQAAPGDYVLVGRGSTALGSCSGGTQTRNYISFFEKQLVILIVYFAKK